MAVGYQKEQKVCPIDFSEKEEQTHQSSSALTASLIHPPLTPMLPGGVGALKYHMAKPLNQPCCVHPRAPQSHSPHHSQSPVPPFRY